MQVAMGALQQVVGLQQTSFAMVGAAASIQLFSLGQDPAGHVCTEQGSAQHLLPQSVLLCHSVFKLESTWRSGHLHITWAQVRGLQHVASQPAPKHVAKGLLLIIAGSLHVYVLQVIACPGISMCTS
mmetsp:Transcript_118963/g.379349  ORF Transcript_118963/g.379349 Transcript_118963/m.379349 type:complete len:127 (-) Transcript_118963:2249-2629(-)